jgi:hypothetical protein
LLLFLVAVANPVFYGRHLVFNFLTLTFARG